MCITITQIWKCSLYACPSTLPVGTTGVVWVELTHTVPSPPPSLVIPIQRPGGQPSSLSFDREPDDNQRSYVYYQVRRITLCKYPRNEKRSLRSGIEMIGLIHALLYLLVVLQTSESNIYTVLYIYLVICLRRIICCSQIVCSSLCPVSLKRS